MEDPSNVKAQSKSRKQEREEIQTQGTNTGAKGRGSIFGVVAGEVDTNSCVYDPNPNSFDYPPDSYHPSHLIYETYSGDCCGNDSYFGTDCLPRFPPNYEPESGYIQNYNSYPHDSPSFPQQYLYCNNCGGLHETFQCQPMNHNFYNSNSSSFDQTQPPQFPVIHPPPQETSIEILYDQENIINYVQTFLRKFNRYSFFEMPKVLFLAWDRVFKIKDAFGNKQYKPEDVQELFREIFNDVQNIHEELAEYINTPGWNHPAFYNNGNDDDEDCTNAITPDFLITDSLIMGDEHLDAILEKESDEFIKSSVEDLVPNRSEFKDKCECDVPDCDDSQTTNFSTFSNSLFDDSTSSDDESSHEEVIYDMSFKTYSNPLFDFDEEIVSRDNLFLERLFHHDPIPLPDTLDFLNVVRVFHPFFTYPVTSSILLSSGSEDTIFDPGISNYHSLEMGVSHRSGTFMKFNIYPNHLNESPLEILSSTCSPWNNEFGVESGSRLVVQYSWKIEDSYQRILSSTFSFPQLQLGIMYPNLID
nr:hypothetical protein [Tanacetum cinerariifolium]